jgi:maltooligosyltrehalose trehalohydrolase
MRYIAPSRFSTAERNTGVPEERRQPEGPHGPSEIVDPGDFAWTDGAWRGRGREQLVIYELHVGTFTPDGSWEAASRELAAFLSVPPFLR